ncbi:MAG: metalloprotease family protein [Dehalococcoidales bacterium]|nr:metalloprotease family protein [Dehalococcoidales bacterium]
MRIPWTLFSTLTFPGVIVHEAAHRLSCAAAGIPVSKTCYFRIGNPAGYVVHGDVRDYDEAFLICTAPFLLNTVLASVSFAVAGKIQFDHALIKPALYWLGFAIAMHSFPSDGDAQNLWDYSKRMWFRNLWALFGFPLVALIRIANRSTWFDLIYALGLLLLVNLILQRWNIS